MKWDIPLFNRFLLAIPELSFDDDFMKAGVAMGAITEEQRRFLKRAYTRLRKTQSTANKLSNKDFLGRVMTIMPEIMSVQTVDFMRRHNLLGTNVAAYNGLRYAFSAAKQLRPILSPDATIMARIEAIYGAATSNYLINFLRDLDDVEIAARRREFLIAAGKDPDKGRLTSEQAASIRNALIASIQKAQRFRSAFSTIDILKATAKETLAQRNAWGAVAVIVDGVFSDQMIKNAIRAKVIPADMVNLIWKLDQLGFDTGKYGSKIFEQALRKGPKAPGDLDTNLVNVFGAGRDLFLSVWKRTGKSFEYESWAARSLLISEGIIGPEMINFLAKTGVISPQAARLMYPAATLIRGITRSALNNYLPSRRYRIEPGESPIVTFSKGTERTDRAILSLLQQAAADAEKEAKALAAKGGIGNVARAAQQRTVVANLHGRMRELWENVGHLTIFGEKEAARMALDSQDFLARNLYGAASGTKHDALIRAMQESARSNVDAFISREENLLPLSARIWRQIPLSAGGLEKEIQKGLLRGLSAEELAGRVGALLKPGIAGGVSYNAMRLARTEINNAFHFTQIRYTREQPWVDGYQWHKSRSHNHVDVCDDRATRNHDGIGRGVYKKKNVPGKAHPHCLCFLTTVTVPPGKFESQLRRGSYDKYLKKAEKAPIDSAFTKATTVQDATLKYAKDRAESSAKVLALYLGVQAWEFFAAARTAASAVAAIEE
jgi:hypothetical protein